MPAELQAQWAKWHPDFSKYDVVVSNYNGVLWSDAVRQDFEQYMRNGGGLVVIHAADNAFAQWDAYNEMIGVGGWYGRNEKDGPKIYWENGKLVRDDSPGRGGAHGKRAEVLVENRNPQHPIMKGCPPNGCIRKTKSIYNMRGPAKNITVLATAMSDPATGGSGKDQPILMTLRLAKDASFTSCSDMTRKASWELASRTRWCAEPNGPRRAKSRSNRSRLYRPTKPPNVTRRA